MSQTIEISQDTIEAPIKENGKKLSFMEKCAVGAGGLTGFLGGSTVNALGMPFYNMMLKVDPGLVGLALAIPRIWDAFTDPLMGNISDNFQSKYGRRRPFILLGAILMAFSFGMIWMVPLEMSDVGKFIWFVITSLVFYTAFTIFSVPHASLTYELSPDYNERTSVQGHVTFWGKVGEILYQAIIPMASLLVGYKIARDQTHGTRIVTWLYAIVGMGLFGSIPAIFGKERYYEISVKERHGKRDSFWKAINQALKNKSFAILCSLSVATMFAGMFASCMDYYLLVYYIGQGNVAAGSVWKFYLCVGYAIIGFVGIPIIVWLCKKTTKLKALQYVYLLMILNAALRWFIYQPGNQFWLWLDPVTGGLFWLGVGIVMQSMIADICDDDELRNGRRREGVFSSIFWWATKLSISISWAFAGVLLKLIGFNAKLEAAQTPTTFMSMRLCMVLGAALPALGCFWVMRFYPLTKQNAEDNRKKLELIRGQV